VTCFAGAAYEQRQRFDLAPGAALILVDWITSGRRARGERWEMRRCQLKTDILIGGRQVVRDNLRLDAADGELAGAACMGRFDCWATVVLVGEALRKSVEEVLHFVAGQRLTADQRLIFSAGPIAGGAMVRIAGDSAEQVSRWLGEHLSFIMQLAGENPWSRKG
jgi:urease accessory protein